MMATLKQHRSTVTLFALAAVMAIFAVLIGVMLLSTTPSQQSASSSSTKKNVLTLMSSWIQSIFMATTTKTVKKPSASSFSSAESTVLLLSDGSTTAQLFPLASLGMQVYESDEIAYNLTRIALEVGYRHFFVDTEHQSAIAQSIVYSGLPRKDVFVTGSVHSPSAFDDDEEEDGTYYEWIRTSDGQHQRGRNAKDKRDAQYWYEFTKRSGRRNMKAFAEGHIHYLDQILLDYPIGADCFSVQSRWRALEEMVREGLIKTLAVSNFSPERLDCLLQDPKLRVKPVVNQLPYNVAYHPANTIQENHQKRGVLVQAWSPLGGSMSGNRFNETIRAKCADVGKKYGNKTWAQVALRWIVQQGAAFTTHSTNTEHLKENLNIFDFELSTEDMELLNSLSLS